MVRVTFLKLPMVLGLISFITSSDPNLPVVILLEQACRPYEQIVVLGVGSFRLQLNGLILGHFSMHSAFGQFSTSKNIVS